MTPELIREGKLDRQAAAEALRQFLENMVRVSACANFSRIWCASQDWN